MKEKKIKACALCPYFDHASCNHCLAVRPFAGGRKIPDKIDVDEQRPKWCYLPIVLVPR